MSEAQLFHCPTCGAPLAFSGDAPVVACTYCNNSVIVPETLRRRSPQEMGPGFLSASHFGDISLLLANNKKIEAIKLLRELSGLGLKEAKDIADAIQRGEHVGPITLQHENVSVQSSVLDQRQLLELVDKGQKIEAIKQLREATGLGLKEAKDVIDALQRGENMALVNALAGGMQFTTSGNSFTTVSVSSTPTLHLDPGQVKTVAKATGATVGCGVILLVLFVIASIAIPLIYTLVVAGPLAPLWNRLNPAAFAVPDLTLQGEGIGPGQFKDPRASAADRDGNLYVADYTSGRMQSFDSQGAFRWMANLGDKTIVQSLVVSGDGVLYIASQGKIRQFETATGKELPMPALNDLGFYIEDLAVSPDGRMALIYRGENLLVVDGDLQPLFEVAAAVSSVTGDSELSSDVAIDASGNVFILGSFNERVLKYSPSGRFLTQFGGETTDQADGRFRAVGDIAVDMDGRVYVSDIFGVQVFDGDGRFLERFKLVQYAHGMSFDLQNRLYIASNEPQVVRLVLKR